jgi:hypothetical protein
LNMALTLELHFTSYPEEKYCLQTLLSDSSKQ